ncbi:hypothetical protein [Roseococcus pinisoli]|uniref:Uncharacterized protein n=1 Tax=Roseococcus pinisoli TaxID=2835040 RepID=A0ABS5QC12_9PROT|nr:hypothetical protein [Roseococcus pinisoli]MBS7811210.1 hypothetical protein [Roseococcus pinisoli]
MGKKAPSMPAAPDPVATAQAQTQSNLETARFNANANRVNQVTPFGTQTWTNNALSSEDLDRIQAAEIEAARARGDTSFDPAAWRQSAEKQGQDRWTSTVTLSPAEQRQLELSNQGQELYGTIALEQLRRAQGMLSEPFNPGVPDRTGQIRTDFRTGLDFGQFGDPNATRDRVEEALNARLAPQQQRDREALDTRLANQGLTMGSEAWNAAQDAYGRSVNDARLAVTAQGRAEQESLYNMALGAGNFYNQGLQFGNAAVGQQANMDQARFQQQLAIRNQPLNEASALLSGQQVQMPQFQQVPQVSMAPTDVIGATNSAYAGQMQGYNAQMQQYNAQMQGMYQLGGQVLGAGLKWGLGGFGK